jgi:hypothetical protein
MDMKKLLNIVSGEKEKQQINESIAECGAMPTPMNSPAPTPPVSMNVSLNAQGIDQIKDLLNLMNKADAPLGPGPVAPAIMPPEPMPVVKMDPPMGLPEPEMRPSSKDDDLDSIVKIAGVPAKKEDDKTTLGKMADEVQDMANTLSKVNKDESWANEPDEKIGDLDDAVPSGDDLHRKKTMYKATQPGDNPMATEDNIKSTLFKLYQEIKESKKAKPDFLDVDKDGNKKEPMKKAVADKKKATKEGFDADAKVGDTFKTAKGVSTKTATGLKHTRTKFDYDPGSDDKDDKKMKRDAKKKVKESMVAEETVEVTFVNSGYGITGKEKPTNVEVLGMELSGGMPVLYIKSPAYGDKMRADWDTKNNRWIVDQD